MAIDVLIVDDDADLRGPLIELLQDEGYLVAEHPSVEGLVGALVRLHPSLCLLDLTMPGDLGQIVPELERLGERQKVTLLALSGLDEAAERADELRLDGAIRKPFDINLLLDLVASVCRGPRSDGAAAAHTHPTE